MVKEISLDFGVAIAYLVPGFVALRGVAFVSPDAKRLFVDSGDISTFAFAIVAAIISGMVVSVARASTVDRTFRLNLTLGALGRLPEHYGSMHRVDPDYAKLTSEGKLNAFLELKASEKRPYQFYGNSLLAILVYLLCRPFEPGVRYQVCLRLDCLLFAVGTVFVLFLLYVAARTSHFRYMKAVEKINALA